MATQILLFIYLFKNQVVHNSVKLCLGVTIGTCDSIVDKILTAIYEAFRALINALVVRLPDFNVSETDNSFFSFRSPSL